MTDASAAGRTLVNRKARSWDAADEAGSAHTIRGLVSYRASCHIASATLRLDARRFGRNCTFLLPCFFFASVADKGLVSYRASCHIASAWYLLCRRRRAPCRRLLCGARHLLFGVDLLPTAAYRCRSRRHIAVACCVARKDVARAASSPRR